MKLKYPAWFPQPVIPADNAPTQARLELGRRLFFDTRLSADGQTSCGSCHAASSAFTDGRSISLGAHGKPGKRNAPTLANLAWMPYFMMEGGVPTLEMQVLSPTQDTAEMGQFIVRSADVLQKDEILNALSKRAYGRDLDVYVVTRALANYQRSFISGDSRWDRYHYLKQSDQLNEAEVRGMNLFFSQKTQCASCHVPPFFSDYNFYNVGLYEEYQDSGKERESYLPSDRGKFKTPTLRNIALTAPYMHDGSIGTLEEVVHFFNTGGKRHPNKHTNIRPLALTAQEENELVAFLQSLTDWNFVQRADLIPLEQ